MSAKDVQFTIRLNAETNHEATVKAKDMNITRAELIRLALDSYLTQTGSNPNPELEKVLLSQLEAANRARSDTIVMQLSTQLQKQTNQIEDLTRPRSVWQRLFSPMPTTSLVLEPVRFSLMIIDPIFHLSVFDKLQFHRIQQLHNQQLDCKRSTRR